MEQSEWPTSFASLENSSYVLNHYAGLEKSMMLFLAGALPEVPDWEIKKAIGLHQWQDSIHANELRIRCRELRGRVGKHMHPLLQRIEDCLLTAPHARALLGAIYDSLKPRLIRFCKQKVVHLFPVQDAPSILLLNNVAEEDAEQCELLQQLLGQSEQFADAPEWEPWFAAFDQAVAGMLQSIFNDEESRTMAFDDTVLEHLQRLGTRRPILPCPQARRPKSFTVVDSYELPDNPTWEEEMIWQFGCGYVQEMQAAETVASVMFEIRDMPWEFHLDLSRHLWDEVRHSSMGEVRLKELGVSLEDLSFFTGNYNWRQEIDPVRRYITLTLVIESSGFPLRNSRLKDHMARNDYLSTQALLFDATDETMHVQYGRKWAPELVSRFGLGPDLDTLVAECRSMNDQRTMNPLQRSQELSKYKQ